VAVTSKLNDGFTQGRLRYIVKQMCGSCLLESYMD